MAILPGRGLGPYEVLSAIGAGGVGEADKARNMRLDRTVAIKILRTHLAGSAGLRARFEREVKTVASLNHTHNCTLNDHGHHNDIEFLAIEYLEGETLAQRLKKGPLPPDQMLKYAIEIAGVLDKVRPKGITHRLHGVIRSANREIGVPDFNSSAQIYFATHVSPRTRHQVRLGAFWEELNHSQVRFSPSSNPNRGW